MSSSWQQHTLNDYETDGQLRQVIEVQQQSASCSSEANDDPTPGKTKREPQHKTRRNRDRSLKKKKFKKICRDSAGKQHFPDSHTATEDVPIDEGIQTKLYKVVVMENAQDFHTDSICTADIVSLGRISRLTGEMHGAARWTILFKISRLLKCPKRTSAYIYRILLLNH